MAKQSNGKLKIMTMFYTVSVLIERFIKRFDGPQTCACWLSSKACWLSSKGEHDGHETGILKCNGE